jgi:hypothetical protein
MQRRGLEGRTPILVTTTIFSSWLKEPPPLPSGKPCGTPRGLRVIQHKGIGLGRYLARRCHVTSERWWNGLFVVAPRFVSLCSLSRRTRTQTHT